jgi:hypothetical protein
MTGRKGRIIKTIENQRADGRGGMGWYFSGMQMRVEDIKRNLDKEIARAHLPGAAS